MPLLLGAGHDIKRPASVLLVSDTFTGADSTGLDVHVPDFNLYGNSWVELDGTWEIFGNQLRETAGTLRECYINVTRSDVVVQATLATPGGADPGIVGRITDNDNYYLLVANSITNALLLWKQVATVFTQLDTFSYTFQANDVIKFRLKGNDLRGYINDIQRVSAIDSAVPNANNHGFFSHAGNFSAVRWDNLTIRTA